MSSTNRFSGILSKEKNEIFQAVRQMHYEFETADKDQESYFIRYEDARHLRQPLTEYSSMQLSRVRQELNELWKDDSEAETLVPVLLSAFMKLRKEEKKYLPDVDLHNYMI